MNEFYVKFLYTKYINTDTLKVSVSFFTNHLSKRMVMGLTKRSSDDKLDSVDHSLETLV